MTIDEYDEREMSEGEADWTTAFYSQEADAVAEATKLNGFCVVEDPLIDALWMAFRISFAGLTA